MKRLNEKKEKKKEIIKMMKELEDMIALIGQDAMENHMLIYNRERNEGDEGLDDEEDEEIA